MVMINNMTLYILTTDFTMTGDALYAYSKNFKTGDALYAYGKIFNDW